ncbi:unnamed protein product, partial [marine sediment metagenome]
PTRAKQARRFGLVARMLRHDYRLGGIARGDWHETRDPGKLFAHPNHRALRGGGGSGLLGAEMRQSHAAEQGHVALFDGIRRLSGQALSCVSR